MVLEKENSIPSEVCHPSMVLENGNLIQSEVCHPSMVSESVSLILLEVCRHLTVLENVSLIQFLVCLHLTDLANVLFKIFLHMHLECDDQLLAKLSLTFFQQRHSYNNHQKGGLTRLIPEALSGGSVALYPSPEI